MPHAVPEIEHSDSGVHSLDSDRSSPHMSFSSYSDQQLAKEREDEAWEEANREADRLATKARDFTQHAEEELSRLEKEGGKKFEELPEDVKEGYQKWKKSAAKDWEKTKKVASKDYQKAKKEAKEGAQWADENKKNPVVIGNAVVISALAGVLGIGAYRLHRAGELTWKVAGAWAGVVGLFAVGDYYVSQ